MKKLWLFVFLGVAFPPNPLVLKSSRGSSFVIGSTNTSIVVAADSRSSDYGKVLGTKDKLIPLGDDGVCFVGLYSVIAEGSDHLDFQWIVTNWIEANRKVTVRSAHESMSEKLLGLMKAFLRRNPKWKPEKSDPFSYFGCVGYDFGKPMYFEDRYSLAPGGDVSSTPASVDLSRWPFVTQGVNKVCDEITKGNTPTRFSVAKSDPSVAKLRKALADRNALSITTYDLLRASRVCLEATESPEGRAFDPGSKFVGPPNRYAVIDQREGFKWVDPPAPLEPPRAKRPPGK